MSGTNQESTRNPFLDFVKGVSIFLVVFGHCIQYGSGAGFLNDGEFFYDILFQTIYAFHMPLFMLVSGFVCFGQMNRRFPGAVLKRQSVGLLLPVLCWTVLYEGFLLTVQRSSLNLTSIGGFLSSFWDSLLRSHWFLWAVFLCTVVFLALRKIRWDNIPVCFGILVLLLFFPDDLIPNYHLYVYVFPYFCMGYFAARYSLNVLNQKRRWILWIAFTMLFALLLPLFSYDSYIYTTGVSLATDFTWYQLYLDLYRWTIGIVGSVMVLLTLYGSWRFLENVLPWVNKMFLFLGRRTTGIYVISTYLNFELLIRVSESFSPNPGINLFEAFVILAFSVAFTVILERIGILRFALLGGRSGVPNVTITKKEFLSK